MEVKLNRIILM